MTVLTQILPGLRELRAPLAAGYAWLIALALMFNERLPETRQQLAPGLRKGAELLSNLGWVSTGVIASSLAYVLGILSLAVSALLTRAVGSVFRSARGPRTDGQRHEIARAVETRLSERYLTDSEFRQAVISRLDADTIITLMTELYRSNQREPLLVGGQAWNLPGDLERIDAGPGNDERLRIARLTGEASLINPRLRAAVLKYTINQDLYVARIAQELDTFPERLLVAAPSMHARWDRLEAEADFRTGLVLPFLTLPAVLYLTFPDHSRSLSAIAVCLSAALALTPAAFLAWTGRERRSEARSQLLAAWQAGVIESSVASSLRAGDVPWFGLRNSEPETTRPAGDSMNSLLQNLLENDPPT